MKIKLFYLGVILTALAASCSKSNDTGLAASGLLLPTGNFTGQFLRIRKNVSTLKYDTVKANLQLSLSQSTGFKVTGDTSIHAGSYGAYGINAYYMQFVDQTYSPSNPSVKYHLEGLYNYSYTVNQLTLYANYADTLSLQYIFNRNN